MSLKHFCGVVLTLLSFSSIAHATYYYDLHFNEVNYLGQDYPASDIYFSSPSILTSDNQTMTYYSGDVDGFTCSGAIVYDASGSRIAFSSTPPPNGTDPLAVNGFAFGAESNGISGPFQEGIYPSNNDAGRSFYTGGGGSSVYYTSGEMTISTVAPTPEPSMISAAIFGLFATGRRARWSN